MNSQNKINVVFSRKIKTTVADLIKLAIAGYTRKLEVEFANRSHTKTAIFAHDAIGRYINLFGVFEGEELDFLFDFLDSKKHNFLNGLALDVGANIGNHSIYFSSKFNKVIAFEPNADVYELLKFNASQCQNVFPEMIGLGDVEGDFVLKEISGNLMASWIDKNSDLTDRKTYKIKIKTLDKLNLPEVKFIKIDVEGYEIEVLKGGIDLILRDQPIILFE